MSNKESHKKLDSTSMAIQNLDHRTILIAKKIKELRISKGYSSYENFAWEIGMSRMQYWRMERGQNFKFETLLKILDAFEISVDDFFKAIDFKQKTLKL